MLACIHINACTRTRRTIHDQSPIVMFAAKTSPHQFETKCNAGNGVWSNKMRCHILTIILGFLVAALAAILIISLIKRIEMFVKITQQLSYICSSTHSKALSKSNVPSTFSICLCIHISLHTITPSHTHTLTVKAGGSVSQSSSTTSTTSNASSSSKPKPQMPPMVANLPVAPPIRPHTTGLPGFPPPPIHGFRPPGLPTDLTGGLGLMGPPPPLPPPGLPNLPPGIIPGLGNPLIRPTLVCSYIHVLASTCVKSLQEMKK